MPWAWPAAHVRGRLHAGDVRSPVRRKPRVGAMRVPEAEVDDRPAGSRRHDARRLGGHRRGQLNEIEQPRLDELGLRQRRVHGEQRLVREQGRAFRHRIHASRKAEPAQVVQELRRESLQGIPGRQCL